MVTLSSTYPHGSLNHIKRGPIVSVAQDEPPYNKIVS